MHLLMQVQACSSVSGLECVDVQSISLFLSLFRYVMQSRLISSGKRGDVFLVAGLIDRVSVHIKGVEEDAHIDFVRTQQSYQRPLAFCLCV